MNLEDLTEISGNKVCGMEMTKAWYLSLRLALVRASLTPQEFYQWIPF
jgi:hypothetical protein